MESRLFLDGFTLRDKANAIVAMACALAVVRTPLPGRNTFSNSTQSALSAERSLATMLSLAILTERTVALAVRAALRAAVKFQMPDSFLLGTGYRGGGPHRLHHGESADDTDRALTLLRPERKDHKRAMLELWQGHS